MNPKWKLFWKAILMSNGHTIYEFKTNAYMGKYGR